MPHQVARIEQGESLQANAQVILQKNLGGKQTMATVPHVIIVGAGFAGLHAAQGLRNAPVRVTVIDRTNHHLFQPLLYQVATASLSPADISAPIRGVLGKQGHTEFIMAEVTGVDVEGQRVLTHDLSLLYDYLVLAT